MFPKIRQLMVAVVGAGHRLTVAAVDVGHQLMVAAADGRSFQRL